MGKRGGKKVNFLLPRRFTRLIRFAELREVEEERDKTKGECAQMSVRI